MFSSVIKASALCRSDFRDFLMCSNQNKSQLFIPRIVRFLFSFSEATSRGSFFWPLSFVSGSALLSVLSGYIYMPGSSYFVLPVLASDLFLVPLSCFQLFPYVLPVLGLPPFGSRKIKISQVILCGNRNFSG